MKMTDREQSDSFSTSDLGLASYLKSRGYSLHRLQLASDDANRVEFVFCLSEREGQDLARDYLNRKATTDALSLVLEMGTLKGLIFRFKNRRNGNGM